ARRGGAGAIAVIGDARPADGAVLREPWARARSDGRPVAAPPALLALLDDPRPALTKRLREAIRPERGRQVPEVEVIVARVETVALVHVLSYILIIPDATSCTSPCTVLACSCTQAALFWSSSSSAFFPQVPWFVDFSAGITQADDRTNNFWVRAVRGGIVMGHWSL